MTFNKLLQECCPLISKPDYKRLNKKYDANANCVNSINSVNSVANANSVNSVANANSVNSVANANSVNCVNSINININPTAPKDVLYVILPYFNYCFFERRKQLFQEFVKRISSHNGLRIVVVEAIEVGEKSQLTPEDVPNTLLHLKIETNHRIWLKENLINIAVGYLPTDWMAMAWIDADLTFLNEHWVEDTLSALKNDDVVQLFERCEFLGPEGAVLKIDKGFGFMHKTSGKTYTKTHKYGFWHPGFAWACSRKAFDAMQGLIDWGILGSGDHHMALALIGKVDISHPEKIHKNYIKRLKEFQSRISQSQLSLGYVKGTLQHHWHGRLEDRKYQERWTILTKHQYDPDEDIYKTKSGLYQLSLKGLRLREEIHQYFEGRQEDRNTL